MSDLVCLRTATRFSKAFAERANKEVFDVPEAQEMDRSIMNMPNFRVLAPTGAMQQLVPFLVESSFFKEMVPMAGKCVRNLVTGFYEATNDNVLTCPPVVDEVAHILLCVEGTLQITVQESSLATANVALLMNPGDAFSMTRQSWDTIFKLTIQAGSRYTCSSIKAHP